LLKRLGQPVDEALQIDVNEEQVIARISGRAAAEGRMDDNEAVVRNRMKVYAEQTAPVIAFYAKKGLLTRILGEGSIEEVFQRIISVLRSRG
jgi:adenylate kinase